VKRLGISLLTLLLLTSCSQQPEQATKTKDQQQKHLVELRKAERKAIGFSREQAGSLRIRRQVRIFSQEEGRIIDLPFYEGDPVEQSQWVAALDDAILQAELAKAAASLGQAQLDLQRLEKLAAQKLTAEDTLARAKTALNVAQAEHSLLATRLTYTRIHAPFAGLISQRLIEPGDIATRNQHLLTIIDPYSLIAEVNVSELLLPLLQVGDPVEIRIDALGEQRFPGHIQRIHPEVNPVSRQAIIEARFDSIPALARGGQLARVIFSTPERERLMVPFTSVQRDTKGEYLYLSREGKAHKSRITTGLRIGDEVSIEQGLQPGDDVIVRGFMNLHEGKGVQEASQRGAH
jgi:membrane fusion protein (multidrug efflux system)